MKIFCDTNVLVAGCSGDHPQHVVARAVMERIQAGQDKGVVAAHSLAELYAVLTRLPGEARVPASLAWQLVSENVLKHFEIVPLTGQEYGAAIQEAAERGIEGGRTYDALLLAAARKSGAERILTFNVGHFRGIAEEELAGRISAP